MICPRSSLSDPDHYSWPLVGSPSAWLAYHPVTLPYLISGCNKEQDRVRHVIEEKLVPIADRIDGLPFRWSSSRRANLLEVFLEDTIRRCGHLLILILH